jgi:XTP/dITP diphosphohydrolase
MKKIYFITSNKGKFVEVHKKFLEIDVNVFQKKIVYPEIQANSLQEVAFFGVEYVLKKFKSPFILEDAGLFIDVFKGFPGVYSAYVFHTIGCDGVLKLMKNIKVEDRSAVFKSVFAYGKSGCKPHSFIGECKGVISILKRGSNGFGYDPIFIPQNSNKTFAEMSINEKNSYSHRGKSLEKLIDFFKKNN